MSNHYYNHHFNKSHSCKVCQKAYNNSKALRNQYNIQHSHSCAFCQKTCRYRNKLRKHQYTHHKATNRGKNPGKGNKKNTQQSRQGGPRAKTEANEPEGQKREGTATMSTMERKTPAAHPCTT